MYRNQIALIFSDFGLNRLYDKFEVPLYVNGILDDPETSESMEQFLAVYDFHSQETPLFDDFLIHYRIHKQMVKYNQDFPVHYIDYYKPSDDYWV